MIYLAYLCSTRHYYGESPNEDREDLLDADTDRDALVLRVNEHYAQPEQMRYNRGQQYIIPPGEMRSQEYYNYGGGGTDYTVQLVIRVAPSLVKTHRVRQALWNAKKGPDGKFKEGQKFGEWFRVTGDQAISYTNRGDFEVESL